MVKRRYKAKVIVIRKPFKYWYPGTDVVSEIVKRYGKVIENRDFIVESEKALSIAIGNIYDESMIRADPLTKIAIVFKSCDTIHILKNIPLDLLAAHKKLGLRYGGLKHFLKPLSEGGRDTYLYGRFVVSLPLKTLLYMLKSLEGRLAIELEN
jgi:F420-0:gamma-glutamyl ligase-like protein